MRSSVLMASRRVNASRSSVRRAHGWRELLRVRPERLHRCEAHEPAVWHMFLQRVAQHGKRRRVWSREAHQRRGRGKAHVAVLVRKQLGETRSGFLCVRADAGQRPRRRFADSGALVPVGAPAGPAGCASCRQQSATAPPRPSLVPRCGRSPVARVTARSRPGPRSRATRVTLPPIHGGSRPCPSTLAPAPSTVSGSTGRSHPSVAAALQRTMSLVS